MNVIYLSRLFGKAEDFDLSDVYNHLLLAKYDK